MPYRRPNGPEGKLMQYKTVYRIVFVWLLLIALVALFGDVSVAASNGGRTAADFLQIGIGAKPAGMGGAYTAVSRGAEASYWNPAGLAGMEGGEISLGHFSWYQDLNLEHGAFAIAVSPRATLAASMTYLNYGTIQGFDATGNPTGNITAYDWAGALSLGVSLSDNIALGLTGKFINQKLDEITGTGFAADIGLRFQTSRFAFAVVGTNLGPDMKFESTSEKLPSTARVGLAFAPFSQSVLTSIEYEKRIYGNAVMRQGLELNFNGQYFLRTGYNLYLQDESETIGTGIAFGAGMHLNKLAFDYAYTLQDKYSGDDLHRFSLGFRF